MHRRYVCILPRPPPRSNQNQRFGYGKWGPPNGCSRPVRRGWESFRRFGPARSLRTVKGVDAGSLLQTERRFNLFQERELER